MSGGRLRECRGRFVGRRRQGGCFLDAAAAGGRCRRVGGGDVAGDRHVDGASDASTGTLVVVVSAEAIALDEIAAPIDSTTAPSVRAATRNLDFTSSTLVGDFDFRRRRQAHRGHEGLARGQRELGDPTDFGEVGPARLDGLEGSRRAVDDELLDRRPLAQLGLGLGPADGAEHSLTGVEQRRRRRATSARRQSATADACTEPSCHQLHTSSVTNGMNGANSRCTTSSAVRSADTCRLRGLVALRCRTRGP